MKFITTSFAVLVAVAAATVSAQQCARAIDEFAVPNAAQTHELVRMPGTRTLVISQMSNSVMVKAQYDAEERVVDTAAHSMGLATDGLHGVTLSTKFNDRIWMTKEYANQLIRVHPHGEYIGTAPVIEQVIPIPAPGKGPHYVGEYGDYVWSTLKESGHVVRINYNDINDYKIWEVTKNPIFIAQHPANQKFYVSCDASSQIHVINPNSATTKVLSTTDNGGAETPAGLVAGPNNAVWFVTAGTKDKGTGKFGYIDTDDNITFFQLTIPIGKDASLLHLAFDDQQTSKKNPGVWLLSSSVIKPDAIDAIIRVDFDPTYTHIVHEEIAVLPTQGNKAHRLLPLEKRIFATELATSRVAALNYTPNCPWLV
ncbi:hypothetical protein GQ42DRAFT_143726 [Ramicandelaber brevisporus]|nr:hypothetical protein GQ42DRAFT_143726 [Ramicandelaber brevisporus]